MRFEVQHEKDDGDSGIATQHASYESAVQHAKDVKTAHPTDIVYLNDLELAVGMEVVQV